MHIFNIYIYIYIQVQGAKKNLKFMTTHTHSGKEQKRMTSRHSGAARQKKNLLQDTCRPIPRIRMQLQNKRNLEHTCRAISVQSARRAMAKSRRILKQKESAKKNQSGVQSALRARYAEEPQIPPPKKRHYRRWAHIYSSLRTQICRGHIYSSMRTHIAVRGHIYSSMRTHIAVCGHIYSKYEDNMRTNV